MPLGVSHESDGFTEWYTWFGSTLPASSVNAATFETPLPTNALAIATTENTARITSSVPRRSTCERAESSMPVKQIQHMAMMNSTPMKVTR